MSDTGVPRYVGWEADRPGCSGIAVTYRLCLCDIVRIHIVIRIE